MNLSQPLLIMNLWKLNPVKSSAHLSYFIAFLHQYTTKVKKINVEKRKKGK